jgi:hypothetical protein
MRDRTIYSRSLIVAVALLAATFLIPSAAGQAQDPRFESQEDAVRFSFARYRNALMTRDGQTAYATTDTNTRAYYDRLIDLIKFGSEEELHEQSYTDLTIILSSRQFIEPDSLALMDGRSLFAHAVDRGWTDREIVAAGVGPIEFRDDVAYGRATLSGVHTLFHWVFRLEDGRWMLDLAEQMRAIDEASTAMLAREGLTPAELAYLMLLRGSGADQVSPDIWQPPFTREP